MTETLELGLRLALAPSPRQSGVVERVKDILDRPLIAVDKNLLASVPESVLPHIFHLHEIPPYLQEQLRASRIVGYANGLDRRDLERVAFIYYDADDVLTLTEIQRGIPLTEKLTPEGMDDDAAVNLFFERGFVPYYPAWAYPQREEL